MTTENQAGSDTWRSTAPCFAVLALLVLATRGIWFGNPVADYDEQLYSFIGWRVTHGELPFVDWWDRKPFGLFAIYAVIHGIFSPSALAYQLVAAAITFGSALMTYLLARRLARRVSATIAASLMVMLLAAYASYSGQSEVFFTPLMLGMALLLVDPDHPQFTRRALLAMLLGGLALQVKYTVIMQCAFFGAWALWAEYRRGRSVLQLAGLAAAFAALGLLPTVLVGLFYAAIGHFEVFWFANFASFFERAAAPQGRWSDSHWIGVAPVAVLGLGGLFAAFRMARPSPFVAWLFFAGWSASALATVLLPGTVYLYYYAAMAAPVALMAVPLFDTNGPAKAWPGLVLGAILLGLLGLPQRYVQSRDDALSARLLAERLDPHVGPADCLWIWDGPTTLYRLTNSCVPTRFVYPDHLNNRLETGALGVDQVAEVERVLATKPGAIVVADQGVTLRNSEATELVQRALQADYERAVTMNLNGRDITGWVRRD
ncbi:ArnT family glycosyltransferase [Aurantiacibacter gangjinensis]|uniref:Glycosyltransferase RgtA/B/C/D-like domain-containing protein n=1 Tax=Aurantiacibacter gangjinensis TaxID=502682 RepID=A0A0G9MRP8_9SPHN|nr:glycosyltransferase family 39 protein [Aurantiacibacter gangjinensis]APE29142.1 hypothetical protein BMF35_a2313 [Aurantiacibacter gangjinensis]KLE33219.1 hypothetical protein AAW01_04450 [Aurantiacibacter gangjinensis]